MIIKDQFLTDILKKNTGHINFNRDFNIKDFSNYEFIYTKTNINNTNILKAKKLNFYLVTTSVLFKYYPKNQISFYNDKKVTFAESHNIKQLEEIAFKNFKYDRFHKDPNISNKTASKIKKNWITNFFKKKRGDKCFIYLNKNNIEGFLLTLKKKNKIFIDLITVKENARGKGVGSKLINTMFSYYYKKNVEFLVGTQINNMPSVNLYQSLGFKFVDYSLVWHYFKNK